MATDPRRFQYWSPKRWRDLRGKARAKREAAERAYHHAFEPHLRCETEREIPRPIFIAAMLGVRALRVVPVDQRTWTAAEETRDALVRAAILAHYGSSGGKLAAFGWITGYTLVLRSGDSVDVGVAYDTRGNRIGPIEVERMGEATLGARGRSIRDRFFGATR